MAGFLALRIGSRLMLTARIARNTSPIPVVSVLRKFSFSRKKCESVKSDYEIVKSDYDIELEKIIKKENWHQYYGFFKDEPFLDKAMAHMLMFFGFSVILVFIPMLMYYGPDFRGRMIEWRRYEAVKLIEEREAKGLPLIDCDLVPPDQIEDMVPPPGDWEEEWLRNQPSVRGKTAAHYFMQVETW